MSDKLDLYELKMDFFNKGGPEEDLLFVCNFNIPLEVAGTLDIFEKIQYIRTLVCG